MSFIKEQLYSFFGNPDCLALFLNMKNVSLKDLLYVCLSCLFVI